MSQGQARLPHGAVAAALTFGPVCFVAWAYWQVLEGEQNTLYRTQFGQWASVTLIVAGVTGVAVIALWRLRAARLGAVAGLVLAAAPVVISLFAEIADSSGFV